MKKILISIIVLIVIFSATYFIQQNLLNKDTTPNTETDTSATTTGEPIALSAQDMVKAGNVEFNVDFKTSAGSKPTVSGCIGKTYTPRITPQGSNVIGPFPYPVQFTFTGSVDDNLKINGRIVDAGKGIQSDSPCSHRHDLTYTADFPANTPIKIELVDQHGGEVAIKGKVSVVKKGNIFSLEIKKYSDSGSFLPFDGMDKGKVIGITGTKQIFPEGTKVTLKAIPDKDARFVNWTMPIGTSLRSKTVECFEDGYKFSPNCRVNMVQDVTLVPVFMLATDYKVAETCFPESVSYKQPLSMPLSVENRLKEQWLDLVGGRLSEKEKNNLRKEMIDTCKIYSK